MSREKILPISAVEQRVKVDKKKVVLCHGCYDIIGPAHIDHLMWAKSLGDFLVVSVSSDEVMYETKGNERPIIPLQGRLVHLAALECVDFVIPWPQRTAEGVIAKLRPAFYVKGEDTKDSMSEEFRREVLMARSMLCSIRYSPTRSCYHTSDIIAKFIERQKTYESLLGMEDE